MSDAFPDKIGAFWDKRDAFLDKLYNPAQLSDSDDRWVRSAALLAGLPETPGKRMEAELRRGELKPIPNLIDRIRQATKVDCGTPTGKVSTKAGLWKGASVEDGKVSLPKTECRDAKCSRPHVLRVDPKGREDRFHLVVFSARIYRLGNAIAKVRIDKGEKS